MRVENLLTSAFEISFGSNSITKWGSYLIDVPEFILPLDYPALSSQNLLNLSGMAQSLSSYRTVSLLPTDMLRVKFKGRITVLLPWHF